MMRNQPAGKFGAVARIDRTAPRQNQIPSAPDRCESMQETFARPPDSHACRRFALFPLIQTFYCPMRRLLIGAKRPGRSFLRFSPYDEGAAAARSCCLGCAWT